ncbi:MAG: enolase C-terminal domain-like protein, partial [Chloroflexota bacterium]
GYERGHRAFKIKVGRGARHLPLEEGTRRDVAVVRAVRQAVGPEPPIMLDANNGYNLNLAKRVLAETADCRVFWLEEAFHEDPVLYRDLREWLHQEGLATLIADGEGTASPFLLDWARDGIVDVIQYDIFGHGFTRWLATGKRLDEWGARTAPHHYGGHYGNYASAHLAGAIQRFTYVEWDEATTPGLDPSGYTVKDGWIAVPDAPGFGLGLDEPVFRRAVETDGYDLSF